MLKYEGVVGESIAQIADKVCDLVHKADCNISFDFNGIAIEVTHMISPAEVVQLCYDKFLDQCNKAEAKRREELLTIICRWEQRYKQMAKVAADSVLQHTCEQGEQPCDMDCAACLAGKQLYEITRSPNPNDDETR